MATPSFRKYRVGVMTVDVTQADPERFERLTGQAIRYFQEQLKEGADLEIATFPFEGPHLTPDAGAYQPLDFIQLGISERAERGFSFLIILTEVDLSSSAMTYTLAMPSQLTNVGIISTKRLDPSYWGFEPDELRASERLGTLMLHTLGRLLNLEHSDDQRNVMSPIQGVESIDHKREFTEAQRRKMREQLPREAFDKASEGNNTSFALKTLLTRFPAILGATFRANPFRLVTKLPTMLATALSVIVVLVFGAETWDYSGAVQPYKVVLFAIISFAAAVFVLYRAFAFNAIVSRDGKLMESTVITAAATALSLLIAVLTMFVVLGALMYFAAETVFPESLKETWTTVSAVTTVGDHLKFATFLASLGILAGSLGGAADSRNLIRNVLFVTDNG